MNNEETEETRGMSNTEMMSEQEQIRRRLIFKLKNNNNILFFVYVYLLFRARFAT